MPRHVADDDLGLDPTEAMELWLGPSPYLGSRFRTREELRQAWEARRSELMQRFGSNGRRPLAFYEFEWDGPRPRYEVERSTLWAAGVLTEQERTTLEREWRREFDRCSKPGFTIARPWPDDLLKGAEARAKHLAWADVPRALIEKWTEERQRPVRDEATSA